MRAQLNKIAEIASEFVKLGIQMGMPTGLNYFRKSKDWLDDIYVIYASPLYKVSSKSTFNDTALFAYNDIRIRVHSNVIEIPLRMTEEQLDEMIRGLETELEHLKTTEGLLELKQVVDDAWNEKKWV